MRLAIYSDLHLEFAPFEAQAAAADVVILAGDIGVGAEGVRWASKRFPRQPVVYVAGNHEFYRGVVETTWADMRAACAPNVHLLENEAVELGGVRFLGCTLWTDYALFGTYTQLDAMDLAAGSLADHRLIEMTEAGATRTFLPKDALAQHVRSRRWLEAQLAQPFDGPTVVVTHHAPQRGSLAPHYARDLLSAAFVSELDPLLGKAALWIHGHTHTSFDYMISGARIVCNPRGYPLSSRSFENLAFQSDLILDLV